jgi:allantoinase
MTDFGPAGVRAGKEELMEPLDLIVRGNVVLPDCVMQDGVVGIEGERIVGLYDAEHTPPHRQSIDARGQWVLPGVVDAHVHCYSTPNEGFTDATRSAAAGGVTTIIEMPYDQGAPVISADRFENKRERLEAQSVVDVALLATIKKMGGLGQIPLLARAGACGFKVSLFETDPERFPRIPDPELLAAFALVRETGLTVGLHCENDDLVKAFTAQYREQGADPRVHCLSRPGIVETSAVVQALEFAQWTGVRVHIYHASLARSFEMVEWYREQGVAVTAETCPHYLTLTEDDMGRLGARGKINPPLRSAEERDRLWELCAAGAVDLITSDHSPWMAPYKTHPNIFDNVSGAPGVETLAPMLYSEGVAKGRLSLHDFTRLLCEGPADVFGLAPRKGRIAVGADADLVLLNPQAEWVLDEAALHSSAGWSPYHGWPMVGRITKTLLRGQVVYDGQQVVAEPGAGQFVAGANRTPEQ